MNKVSKIISMIAMMVLVISMTFSVQAYNYEDVISYITRAHTVNGRTLQLTESVAQRLTQYLRRNPVTDAKAGVIIAKLEDAEAKLRSSKANTLGGLENSIKAEVVRLVKEAGKEAGLNIEVDSVNDIATIKDLDGNVIVSAKSYSQYFGRENTATSNNASGSTSGSKSSSNTSGKKLVYTGNTAGMKTIVAIVAIAIAGVCVKKYAK